MISGAYYLAGENLCFQVNITDIEHRKLLFSLEPVIGAKKSLTDVIDKLKQKILGAVIAYFDFNYTPPPGFKTPTFDAYKEYMAGVELFGRDFPRAISHFKRALELDPDFQIPKFFIAAALVSQGKYAGADTILRQLQEKRNRLTHFERYIFEWLRTYISGDRENALRWIRKAGEMTPKSRTINYIIGLEAVYSNRPQETIDTYDQFDAKFWSTFTYNSLRINIHSRAYHMLGNFQRELELARKGQEIFPGQMEFFIIEAQALAAFGKIEEVKKVIDKSLRISSLSGTPGNVMWMAALELRAHGHIKAYREIVKRTAAWYKNRPPQEAATEKHRYNLARVLYLAEQWDESERISKDLAEKKPDNIEYKGNLGVLAARKGNQKEARQVLEQLKNMNRPYLFGRHTYWCARIASLLDEKQRAVELLKESFAQGMIYRIDLHREIDFEPIKDFPPFKELIQPKVRESL